ncbi:hypothetical protein SO802_000191 [Lithocarpus litseifolius]|uniref:Uncharacterized protein n=1 Tax=Lithocarpus litseifolius TaxID=425828 RepID=A0AAW2DRB3_9ROSI
MKSVGTLVSEPKEKKQSHERDKEVVSFPNLIIILIEEIVHGFCNMKCYSDENDVPLQNERTSLLRTKIKGFIAPSKEDSIIQIPGSHCKFLDQRLSANEPRYFY